MKTNDASPVARLKSKALACIAQREHSRVELRTKLLAYLARQRRAAMAAEAGGSKAVVADADRDADGDADGADALDHEAAVDALLDWLVERDLLSTERFIEGRVRTRATRFGQLRVRQELARHGLALDAEAERQLRDTELARAHAVWARRFGTVTADPAQRAKQMRFLLARGFDAEVARRVVAGAGASVEDEAAEAR